MDADYSVELGDDDDTLEFPWASPDRALRYWDLKRHPELLVRVDEANRFQELASFLAAANSAGSALLTAKCDAWTDDELNEAEAIYDTEMKFCSYIDLLLDEERSELRFDFGLHERLARRMAELLGKAPEMKAAAEFIVRRCYYRLEEQVRPGYYLTFYLFGYGDDEQEARQRWGIALILAQKALLQLSSELRGAPK